MRCPQLLEFMVNPFSTDPDICAPYLFCNLGSFKGVSNVVLLDTSIRICPSLPFLVVIISTPLEAALPQRAAELAPFSTVIDSMSSGLSWERASLLSFEPSTIIVAPPPSMSICPATLFCMGTPSITMSGELLPSIDALPRRRILEAPPAPPELGVMTRPALFPCNELMRLASFARVSSSPPTVCVE